MSTSNEGIGYMESVLIAYGWSRTKPTDDLPDDIVALCPGDLSLALMPRVTGFIHRQRVPKADLNDPPSALATAVTFFRITASVEQTRKLGHSAKWPILCRRGSAMVTWTLLSDIEFTQLYDAKVIEMGLLAALQKFGATDLLLAINNGLHAYRSMSLRGQGHKGKRRKLNHSRDQIGAALAHIRDPGGNLLGRPPPPMQPLAGTAVDPVPFHAALAMSNDWPQVPPLHRDDLAGVDEKAAIALVMRQLVAKAGEAIHSGRAIAPRTGIVYPSSGNRRGSQPDLTKHPRQSCPKTSKVFLDVIGTELPPDCAHALQLSKGKNCGVWIAPLHDVLTSFEPVFSLGVVRQIVGVDARQSEITVAPGLPWPEKDSHTVVVTLILEDLHGYYFAHEALRLAWKRGGDEASLRMFWGMPPSRSAGSSDDPAASAISAFFGQACSLEREGYINDSKTQLQVVAFTPSQLEVLRGLRGNARVDCPPGCGKTLLALALCVRILQSPVQHKLWVTQASLLQVDSFFTMLQEVASRLGATDRITRMGRGDNMWDERFHQHVEKAASGRYPAELEMLHLLDRVVKALVSHLHIDGMEALAVHVMKLRVNLWATLQHLWRNIAREIVDRVQVVVSTACMRVKHNARLVPGWSRYLLRGNERVRWGLIKDEYHQESHEETAAGIVGAHWALYLGDGHQAKEPTGGGAQPMLGGPLLGTRQSSHDSPLRRHSTARWLDRNMAVDTFELIGSHRLGGLLVRVLQHMFPGKYNALKPRHGHETMVLPVVFERRLQGDHDDSGYFQSNRRLFAQAAQILGLEVLEWVAMRRTKPILVLACHLTMLQRFVVYAHQKLRGIIEDLQRINGRLTGNLEGVDFSLEALVDRRAIAFAGMQKSGGFDGQVAILLLPHRNELDAGWRGDLVERHLIYIGLSRVSERVWVLLEDLRGEIVAPRKRAAQHALHEVSHFRGKFRRKTVDGLMGQSRAQMPWVRFLEMLPTIYEIQNIPDCGLVGGEVAPALRAPGLPFRSARLTGNLDWARRLYNDVWWGEKLPRALVVKDGQGDSTSFLRLFSARHSVWRLANDCTPATEKGRKRRREEVRRLPNLLERYALTSIQRQRELERWNKRALESLSCVVQSEKYLEVLVPLAWFLDHEDPSRVAEALAQIALHSYRRLTSSKVAKLHIRRHKKELHDLGPHGVRVVQHCASNRPSFQLEDTGKKFSFYAACGMLSRQSYYHQTLRGVCTSVDAAASLLHAATKSMTGLVLRSDMVRHDPEMAKAVNARENLFLALNKLGVEIKPPVQHRDLVALCKQNRMEPSRLMSRRTIKDIFPFLQLISPWGADDS